MKLAIKLVGSVALAVGFGWLCAAPALARTGRSSGGAPTGGTASGYTGGHSGGSYGGNSGGYHGNPGGYSGGYKGGYSGGYYGGYKGGYYGGYGGKYYNGGKYYGGYCSGYPYSYYGSSWWPWAFSFSYNYSPPVYYSAPAVYYETPVVYSSPTVVYSSPPSTPPAQAPQNGNPERPMSPADVTALVKSGVNDDVIISQIRSTRTVFRLSTAEIIDMKNNGVSEKVIDFMINTASR
jgi:hypothetical protein